MLPTQKPPGNLLSRGFLCKMPRGQWAVCAAAPPSAVCGGRAIACSHAAARNGLFASDIALCCLLCLSPLRCFFMCWRPHNHCKSCYRPARADPARPFDLLRRTRPATYVSAPLKKATATAPGPACVPTTLPMLVCRMAASCPAKSARLSSMYFCKSASESPV